MNPFEAGAYGFTTETVVSNPTTGFIPMPAGINENVTLTDIAAEPLKRDGSGGMVLAFKFEDTEGRKFEHKEFVIDQKRTQDQAKNWFKSLKADERKKIADKLKMPTLTEPAYVKFKLAEEFATQAGRISHILTTFVDKDVLIQEIGNNFKSWEEYIARIAEVMQNRFEGVPVRIKVVLNSKDYTRFPNKAVAPFIQRMDARNALSLHPKLDRIVPKAATPEDEIDEYGVAPDTYSEQPAAAPADDDFTDAAPAAGEIGEEEW